MNNFFIIESLRGDRLEKRYIVRAPLGFGPYGPRASYYEGGGKWSDDLKRARHYASDRDADTMLRRLARKDRS